MRDKRASFKWYWFLDDVPSTSITWLVAAVSAWTLLHIWPPLSLVAILSVVAAHVVVQRRAAKFLADLGSERLDLPRYFLVFWWSVLSIEVAITMVLLILKPRWW
jgi:hypothetical protein